MQKYYTLLSIVATIAVASVAVGVLWTLGELHTALTHADAAITSLSGVVEQERQAQTNQTREFQKTIADVHDLVIHTDMRLNGNKNLLGVLPQMQGLLLRTDRNLNETLLPDTDKALQIVTLDVHDTLTAVHSTLDSLTTDADDLHGQLSNPAVPELLGHFNVITLHLEGIAANSEAMSQDMRLAVHRLAQPPSKFHQFLDVAWTGAKFGSLFVP